MHLHAARPAARPRRCPGCTSASSGSAGCQGVQGPAGRHPAADGRLAVGRSVAGPVGRHRGPRGHRPDGRGVPAGAGRDPARRRDRGRAERRRRAHAERGLRVGRDGDPHPARGRRQPVRAAQQGRRDDPRAGVPPAAGADALGRGPALGLDPRRPAAGLHGLPRPGEPDVLAADVHDAARLGHADRHGGAADRSASSG